MKRNIFTTYAKPKSKPETDPLKPQRSARFTEMRSQELSNVPEDHECCAMKLEVMNGISP